MWFPAYLSCGGPWCPGCWRRSPPQPWPRAPPAHSPGAGPSTPPRLWLRWSRGPGWILETEAECEASCTPRCSSQEGERPARRSPLAWNGNNNMTCLAWEIWDIWRDGRHYSRLFSAFNWRQKAVKVEISGKVQILFRVRYLDLRLAGSDVV